MKRSHILLLSALFLLCDLRGVAQPGGDASRFSALETCNEYYLDREHVFIGRVISIAEVPSPYQGGSSLWKALVAVEIPLKGQLSGQVELAVVKYPPTKDWQIKDKRFIFTAQWISNSEFSGLYSTKWSTPLDDIPPDMMARVVDGIRAVLLGVPQPRIVGTVREQSWGISFDPVAGHALSGIPVVAENKDGRQFKTHTDVAGRFQFAELPTGLYWLYPILPRKMELYDQGFMLQEEGKKYVRVGSELCSREVRFVAQEVGSIAGRIEREKGDWAFGEPLLYLYRINPDSRQIDGGGTRLVPSEVSLPQTDSGGAILFSFAHIPVGSYVLSIGNIDPTGQPETMYYPGVRDAKDAQPVKVVADKPTEVVIKLPSLRERRIFGHIRMPDDAPVNVVVRLVDVRFSAEESTEGLEGYDLPPRFEQVVQDGRFEFRYWEGRKFRLFAYYDGTKDGTPARFFGRSQNLLVNGDVGPIEITLDRVTQKK
jgi:hypothetical protein